MSQISNSFPQQWCRCFRDIINQASVEVAGGDSHPSMAKNPDHTFDAETTKPAPYVALRLYFSDGSRKGGIWTGRVWWSEGHPVFPVRWERMEEREHEKNQQE